MQGQPQCARYLSGENRTPKLSGPVRNQLLHALKIFDDATASRATYEDAAHQGREAYVTHQAITPANAPVHGDQVEGACMMHAIAEPDDDAHDYEPGASGGNESQPNSQSTSHSTPSSSPDEEKCVDIVIYLAVRFRRG